MLPLLRAAHARGDEVVLVAPEGLRPLAAEAGLELTPIGQPTEEVIAPIRAQLPVLPQAEAARLGNVELFGRLATEAALPTIEQVVGAARPDLVLRDPCEHASVVAATRRSVAFATVAISLAEAEWGAVTMVEPVIDALAAGATDLVRRSPYVTAFPAALDPSPFPDTLRLRPDEPSPQPLTDWWPGDARPLVYLTMGTVLGHMDIAPTVLRTLVDAVATLPVRVLLTTGRAVDPAALGELPSNVHAEQWVTQADALAVASLVVCHGGSGTTFAALAAGLPVVVVPAFADQFANGRLVAASGAGRCVERPPSPTGQREPPGPDMIPAITAAVAATLDDPAAAAAAARIAADVAASAGPGDALEQLCAGG